MADSTPQRKLTATATATSEEFRELSRKETETSLHNELQALLATSAEPDKQLWAAEFRGYEELFGRFLRDRPTVDWSKILPPPAHAVRPYDELPSPDEGRLKSMLEKLVVVKLNGGLGTSMGCKGPKSLISVRNDLTFLDLTIQQIQRLNIMYDVNVPLVLMNSFNTDDDTNKALIKYRNVNVEVICFNQSRYPRVNKETLMPIAHTVGPKGDLEDWYPPGHGNFYEAFNNSGLLDKFIAQGKEYVFLSNIDNMGATVDVKILNFILSDEGNGGTQPGFVMEVTDKTRADVKGGTLITYEDKLRLLEAAQVPKNNIEEFKSVTKFRIFNTNNLWANLKQIKENVTGGKLDMEIIVNPKNLDSGVNVIQLETAAGAAIKAFSSPRAINVPRARFLPVKKTQDLLLLMSNLYEIDSGTLVLSSERQFRTTPLVKLGTSFDRVHNFLGRFAGIPDLLELDHLTVSGDVTFGSKVTLKGTVIIIAHHGERIDIPNGSILENKIVSGNLRILDH